MCDYSLKAVKSQPANEQDKLVTHNFGFGTVGFRLASDDSATPTAVCVMPGTEIAFDEAPTKRFSFDADEAILSKIAIFRQINTDDLMTHHDALEFASGEAKLLNYLAEGQTATVLQLPAAPQTEQEAKAQRRLEIVG